MSPLISMASVTSDCFPRVSGDEPVVCDDVKAGRLFSPRERG